MKPEIRDAWVTALRSGDYKMGRYMLRDVDGHCDTTGVLCELAVKAGIIPEPIYKGTENRDKNAMFYGYLYGEEQFPTGLPAAVVEWAGISYRKAYSVAMRCDRFKNFKQCADYIEKEFAS